ncbi:hypothetical protein DRO61_07695 [Candidatus Bathyarchaeota archaeon]|nr:MAG: hypothetical protein DRO61_07695 [Candidatus Bathyarchaeota archaeon]
MLNDFKKQLVCMVILFSICFLYVFFYPIEWIPSVWRSLYYRDRIIGLLIFGTILVSMIILFPNPNKTMRAHAT